MMVNNAQAHCSEVYTVLTSTNCGCQEHERDQQQREKALEARTVKDKLRADKCKALARTRHGARIIQEAQQGLLRRHYKVTALGTAPTRPLSRGAKGKIRAARFLKSFAGSRSVGA